jgi:NAD(P)H-flavin reductase
MSAKIVKREELAKDIFCYEVETPLIANKAKAGQFVILRIHQKGERIPLTIADFDREKGTITMVFQVLGKTTLLLSRLRENDHILNILGPQGNPSEIKDFGHVAVVGGGVGVAAIHPIMKALKEKNNKITSIIGYRSKELVFWEGKIKAQSHEVLVYTNDGSYGKAGLVTDGLKEVISREKIDRVIAVGPLVMMDAVTKVTKEYNIPTIVSLNSLMVCGMGMCGACRVTINGKIKFTCMDGPEFNAFAVDFDELKKRLNSYKEEEKICYKKELEKC